MGPIKKQAFGLPTKPGAAAAPAPPTLTLIGMAAVGGVHKFGVQGEDGFNTTLFQPRNKPIDVDKIAVNAMEMYDIRLFFFDDTDKLRRGKEAPAVHQPGEAREKILELGIPLGAGLIDVRLPYLRAATVANDRLNSLLLQLGMDIIHNLACASLAIHAIDL